ncbi:hypothetical protein KC19_6G051700 [Ceratodon purpureus]|uniref:Uncharacterized protein n=1 Tax=Ceratodon purpureus TaxID=3225 RepID=A0A8T0HEQ5_CERPU|nr:hypothetical protein KC19_6G051700 [Ceratodon purpureus]
MEGRRMSTRSSRRAAPVPVSPVKQAVMATVTGAGKSTARRSTRKVLADKTNATPDAGLLPSKSPKKGVTAVEQIKEVVSTPCRKRLVEEMPVTPVMKGEDLLRSLAHSNLSITQTPNGPAVQNPEAATPQFGVPPSPYQDKQDEPEVAAEVSMSPSEQAEPEVIDVKPIGASPLAKETPVSERLSSAWVGRDVDDVTEVGDDDDSDCSVLVNVSSPGLRLAASPAPTSTLPSTPQTADFKWQRRDSQKVKESEGEGGFNYYEDEGEEYEGCDEYDGEDFGEVIDCDEICQGISRIQVAEGLPEHKGRHIRFNYTSDGEIDVEEVDGEKFRLCLSKSFRGQYQDRPNCKGMKLFALSESCHGFWLQ